MKKTKANNVMAYLDDTEYETFKKHSKKSGVSMNQLIKNYISTIDEPKQNNNDIEEQLQLITNLVNSPRFNIDSTVIESKLKESSKNTLSNILDTFELFKDDFQDNQKEIKHTVDSNITSLTELIKNQNETMNRNFKTVIFLISYVIASRSNLEIRQVLPDVNKHEKNVKDLAGMFLAIANRETPIQ